MTMAASTLPDTQSLAGGDAVRRQRREALEKFEHNGFPGRKTEAWRHTDLRPLAEQTLQPAGPLLEGELEPIRERINEMRLPLAGPRIVFVDGHFVASLSEVPEAAGISVIPLQDYLTRHDGGLPPLEGHEERPLGQLNTALVEHGAVINASANTNLPAPLHLVFAGTSREGLAAHVRILFECEPGSQLACVQHFVDTGVESGWFNLVNQLRLAAGSWLTLYTISEHTGKRIHTALHDADIAADAQFNAGFVNSGGRLVRNDIDIRLNEPGAHVRLFGASLANEDEHADTHIRIDHSAADTNSEQYFRSIVGHKGHSVFRGKVIVHKDAQRIDASQRSDNLMLDDSAEIDTRPELEIYADDVKCSHGATVGELDEQQLFYLQSRGVPEEAARGLLIYAFANDAVSRIEDQQLRYAAAARLAARLPRHEQWEELL